MTDHAAPFTPSRPRHLAAMGDVRPEAGAFAALDLGTNNCRLLVAAPSGGGFRVLDSFSRIVGRR